MVVLFVIEIAGAITAYVYKDEVSPQRFLLWRISVYIILGCGSCLELK